MDENRIHNENRIHKDTDRNQWKRTAALFLASQCVTLFGSTLVQMAVVWYVTVKTSSGAWVGAVSICSYLPQFLISFPGGAWADRYNRKALISGADAMTAGVTFLMILAMPYMVTDTLLLICLLLMSALRSVGAGIQTPAVNAVIPQIVPKEELMRYNGINAAMQSLVQFAAPAAAGALLSAGSLRDILFIDIITAAAGISIVLCLAFPEKQGQRRNAEGEGTQDSVLPDIRKGISYAFINYETGRLLAVYGGFVLLTVPAGYLAGLLVSRVFGSGYEYLTAVEVTGFAGMVLGGVTANICSSLCRRWKNESGDIILSAGLVVFGAMAVGMSLTGDFILYLIQMFVYGIALTVIQTSITTMIQEKTDPDMQGRVFGLLSAVYSGLMPLGMLVFGAMADKIPLQWIMAGAGAGLVMMGVRAVFSGKGG